MTTVSFSMSRTILVETEDRDPTDVRRKASEVTFEFNLDSPPPPEGVNITITSDAIQIFSAFVLGFTEADIQVVGADRPVPDFDFSAFDLNITSQRATVTLSHFDDEDDTPDPSSPFPSYDGFREVTFFVEDGDDYDVDPDNDDVLVWFADERNQLPQNARNSRVIDVPNFVGTRGSDTFLGTKDNNIVRGKGGDDTLSGIRGKDTIAGGGGDDIINGGGGSDRLRGGGGNDEISGGGGKDNIAGGGGDDTLLGGGGSDTIVGGGGNDIYVLERKSGQDTFRGFRVGQDQLGLSNNLTFDGLTITAQGNNTLIRAGSNSLAILQGIQPDALSEADFIVV
ncbi:MAG: hypothetical protein AAGD25_00220 [Cyanobacteria bacterium P01_F01_bin.150]